MKKGKEGLPDVFKSFRPLLGRDVRFSVMLSAVDRKGLEERMRDLRSCGATGDATMIFETGNGATLIAHSEEGEAGKYREIVYGIFDSCGRLLPDLHACGVIAGKYEKVSFIFRGLLGYLRVKK